MTEEMSRAKAKVLAVYPDAYTTYHGGEVGETEVWSSPAGGDFIGSGVGRSLESIIAAWIDAASRLPAEPKDEDAPIDRNMVVGVYPNKEFVRECERVKEAGEELRKTISEAATEAARVHSVALYAGITYEQVMAVLCGFSINRFKIMPVPKPEAAPEAAVTSKDVGISWARPEHGTRRDIVGVRDLIGGRKEYLMHNEALCHPYYTGVSEPATEGSLETDASLPCWACGAKDRVPAVVGEVELPPRPKRYSTKTGVLLYQVPGRCNTWSETTEDADGDEIDAQEFSIYADEIERQLKSAIAKIAELERTLQCQTSQNTP